MKYFETRQHKPHGTRNHAKEHKKFEYKHIFQHSHIHRESGYSLYHKDQMFSEICGESKNNNNKNHHHLNNNKTQPRNK